MVGDGWWIWEPWVVGGNPGWWVGVGTLGGGRQGWEPLVVGEGVVVKEIFKSKY